MLEKGERKHLSGHKAGKNSAHRLRAYAMFRLHLRNYECKLTVYVPIVKGLSLFLIRNAL